MVAARPVRQTLNSVVLKEALLNASLAIGFPQEVKVLDEDGQPTGEIKMISTGEGGTQGYLEWLGLNHPRTVCRQNISDIWFGNLREYRLIWFEGSGCDCLLMQAASLFDGLSFDGFPPFEYGRSSAEVDVSRR